MKLKMSNSCVGHIKNIFEQSNKNYILYFVSNAFDHEYSVAKDKKKLSIISIRIHSPYIKIIYSIDSIF